MDRSKAPKQSMAADTAASVQAFAGSILNKHRPGRGRNPFGSTPMQHAKPKGESAGVQQRIHIHVTPPRGAEPSKKRKTEETPTVRIIEREKVRVEHKTIVVREIVRIMDHQRTARALAMTAPVQLEVTPEHRPFPDVAASLTLDKQAGGARRKDHHSGPQPAATTLVTSIHKESGKPYLQGLTLERLRRNVAAGVAGVALAPLRREAPRREGGGGDAAAAHIAAKKRPLTHARREAVSAAAAAEPARAKRQSTLAEAAAKRRAAKAAEAEQTSAVAEQQATLAEAAAKRRAAKAAEAEQASAVAEKQAARTEGSAKRRAAEAAESDQPSLTAKPVKGVNRRKTDLVHKKQKPEGADASDAAAPNDPIIKVPRSGKTQSPVRGKLSDSEARDKSGSHPSPVSTTSSATSKSPSRGTANSGNRGAKAPELAAPVVASQQHAGRLLFLHSGWNTEQASLRPESIRERQDRLTRQWLTARLSHTAGSSSVEERKNNPIKARKLIYRQAEGVVSNERRTPLQTESSLSRRPASAASAVSPDWTADQHPEQLLNSGNARLLHNVLAPSSIGSANTAERRRVRPPFNEEVAARRRLGLNLPALKPFRSVAGSHSNRRFPELLAARRRPSAESEMVASGNRDAQPRQHPVHAAKKPTLQPELPQKAAARSGVQRTTGNEGTPSSLRMAGPDTFSMTIGSKSVAPILARRGELQPDRSNHVGHLDGALISNNRSARSAVKRIAAGFTLNRLNPSGSEEHYKPGSLRSRQGALILRRAGRGMFAASNSPAADGAKDSKTANAAAPRIAGRLDVAASTGVRGRNDRPDTAGGNGQTTSENDRMAAGTAIGAPRLIGRTSALNPATVATVPSGIRQIGPTPGHLTERGVAYKPLGLVLRRMPESLGSELVRLARSNRMRSDSAAYANGSAAEPAATARLTADSRSATSRPQRRLGTLIGRSPSTIPSTPGQAGSAGAPAPSKVDEARTSAESSTGGRVWQAQPAPTMTSLINAVQRNVGGSRQTQAVAQRAVLVRRTSSHTGSYTGNGLLQAAAQRASLIRRTPANEEHYTGNGASQTVAQRAALTRHTSAGAKPNTGSRPPQAVVQRTADAPRVPLIARPFALGMERSIAHDAFGYASRQPSDGSGAAVPSTLAYSRAATDSSASGIAASPSQFASVAASPSSGVSASLTHRSAPSAPAEPPRQVHVEAPRELEPEKLQRMIMKMPQLNPEAIADRVYKALERKMKLEQRRNGY